MPLGRRTARPGWPNLLIAVSAWLSAGPVTACPVCDTSTGHAIRAGIFAAGFGHNLLVSLAPFVVTGLGVALLPRLLGRQRSRRP